MCGPKVVTRYLFMVFAAALLTLCPAAANAAIRYAKPTATGAGDCGSWANACTLQDALTGATSNDEIWVMAGTHSPGPNRSDTFQLESGVAVYGGFAGTETARSQRDPQANATILSGDINGDDGSNFANNVENNYHVVTGSGTDASAVLDGVTVSGGNADGSSGNDGGGGMVNSWISSPTLNNVTFSGNSAAGNGGGMYNGFSCSPTLSNVTFSGNSAGYGGGMYNEISQFDIGPTLTNVTFSSNSADNDGGGMYNQNESNPVLTNVTFSGNTADHAGGGMYNNGDSSPILNKVTFSANTAVGDSRCNYDYDCGGGGMYNRGSSPTLTNVTFSGNSGFKGGGLVNTLRGSAASEMSDPTLNNVTFSCNSAITYGGGMWNFYSNPVLSNVILWGDTAGSEGPEIYNYNLESYTLTITDSVVEGGCPADQYSACTNVITDDPKLGPLAANGGFTQTHALLPGSSAIDAGGVNSSCEATDQRGVPRPQGAACDIGAYEFLPPLFSDGFECGSCASWSSAVGEVP